MKARPILQICRDHATSDLPVAQVAGQVLWRRSPRYRLEAISRTGSPRHLSSDHDPLFRYPRWQANLRVFDIQEVRTLPDVVLSHLFVIRVCMSRSHWQLPASYDQSHGEWDGVTIVGRHCSLSHCLYSQRSDDRIGPAKPAFPMFSPHARKPDQSGSHFPVALGEEMKHC